MRRGTTAVTIAYLWWGLSPIFWRIAEGVSAVDLIGVRVTAAAVLLAGVLLVRRNGAALWRAARDRRAAATMAATALLLGSNWLVFIWAVTTDRVLESSLGYFLNPLVSVLLGVTVLRERLRRGQWTAIGVAGVGVAILSIDLGSLPCVSLFLAVTFGLYGLLRKVAPLESLDGLTVELGLLAPLAIGVLAVRTANGQGLQAFDWPIDTLFVIGAGLVTVVPLLLFGFAARQIKLSLVGVLQYIVPTIQFFLGVFVYNEAWSGGQAVGFITIWVGLAVFAVDGLRASRAIPFVDGIHGVQR